MHIRQFFSRLRSDRVTDFDSIVYFDDLSGMRKKLTLTTTLGDGATSTVFLAVDDKGKEFAVKFGQSEALEHEKVYRERIVAAIPNANSLLLPLRGYVIDSGDLTGLVYDVASPVCPSVWISKERVKELEWHHLKSLWEKLCLLHSQ